MALTAAISMYKPRVWVNHVDPKLRYLADIDPVEFWKAVNGKMKPCDFGNMDDTDRRAAMIRLATGPAFNTHEIKNSGIATDGMGRPVDNNFNPDGFAACVIKGVMESSARTRSQFFSRQVLEEAGIIPKPEEPSADPPFEVPGLGDILDSLT